VTLILSFLAAVAVNGCSTAEGDIDKVGDKLQRGLQGQGQIVPNHPTGDSFGSDYN
jgi:hypothetical protein